MVYNQPIGESYKLGDIIEISNKDVVNLVEQKIVKPLDINEYKKQKEKQEK